MIKRLTPPTRRIPLELPVQASRLTCRRLRKPTPLPTVRGPAPHWTWIWRWWFNFR